jgi:hypothetical protein
MSRVEGDLEDKTMTVIRLYPNPRSNIRGDQANTNRCEFCKKEGHRKDECWCFHPNLRPKGGYKGGFKGRKSPIGGEEWRAS